MRRVVGGFGDDAEAVRRRIAEGLTLRQRLGCGVQTAVDVDAAVPTKAVHSRGFAVRGGGATAGRRGAAVDRRAVGRRHRKHGVRHGVDALIQRHLAGRRHGLDRVLVEVVQRSTPGQVRSLDAHDLEEGLAGLREVGSLRKMA
eukprot:SAG25_NODE_840_length_5120_cov_3.796455_4_plen_144_part_00